jgi:hypothetical protein
LQQASDQIGRATLRSPMDGIGTACVSTKARCRARRQQPLWAQAPQSVNRLVL